MNVGAEKKQQAESRHPTNAGSDIRELTRGILMRNIRN